MKRLISTYLAQWQQARQHLPLLLRGARQVGKSYVVEQFGQEKFTHCLSINFEKHPEYLNCFTSLNPKEILERIFLVSGQQVTPGQSLLFLDEIQECPRAILSLRYFKEDLPDLHVIAAGSLLEFVLNNDEYRMPVGRVQSLYMSPLSFYEYLDAAGQSHIIDYLQSVTLQSGVESVVHDKLLSHLQKYFYLGGMPDILREYFDSGNLQQVQALQASITDLYRRDFGKYASKTKYRYMQDILQRAPGLLGEHFKYVNVNPDVGSRELKEAMYYLVEAGIIHKVNVTNASGLPLNAQMNEKIFKILLLDIGLANAIGRLSPELLLQPDLMRINRGALAEQFVGQELIANAPFYLPPELHFWERNKPGSQAEVDYVINIDEHIIPIEVKAGKTGSFRSLQSFLNEKQSLFGLRLSLSPLEFQNRIFSIPFYLVPEIPRLVKDLIKRERD